ncbi:MAG: bifunctional ornithine acetyltransferase/N-acetylglutamate synthase [Chloroflexi bacterium RBG_16_50_9]|nr:MAG: bifunctional ornithine acetyltransferase/N-acetylglutamate synthase [Chloroflexi bacterium RBG_16_50_9]
MKPEIESIPSGGVTSPGGFRAGATCAGIKKKVADCLDLGILLSETPCAAAAVFTTNKIKAAPVILSRKRLRSGRAVAVVVNSGCANACTGETGLADAEEMAALAARHIGVGPEDVLIASTGVIGERLPMERIKAGIGQVVLAADGGHRLAKAIMTTDTVPKEAAVRSGAFTIGGTAKGAGMIHPNLATLLCFLTTDARVDVSFLRRALREAVDISFNMISIDGDTSTNDTVLIMANGLAANKAIVKGGPQATVFRQALNQVCIYLARAIARDGEGATKLIEVKVSGAASLADARLAARTIVSSPLVKSAVHGCDPNWGRVVAAAGRSGIELVPDRIDLNINGIRLLESGCPLPFDREEAVKSLDSCEVAIALNLNSGSAGATAWGCDLSEEYVKINSQYTT